MEARNLDCSVVASSSHLFCLPGRNGQYFIKCSSLAQLTIPSLCKLSLPEPFISPLPTALSPHFSRLWFRAGVSNLRPASHMRPLRRIYAARDTANLSGSMIKAFCNFYYDFDSYQTQVFLTLFYSFIIFVGKKNIFSTNFCLNFHILIIFLKITFLKLFH